MKKIRFKGVEDIILSQRPKGLKNRVKWFFTKPVLKVYYAFCRMWNAWNMRFLCNLHPQYRGRLTREQETQLNAIAQYCKSDRFVKKGGKLLYTVPALEDVTIWQVIETRRSEQATEIVANWCTRPEGGNKEAEYAPDNIYHLLTTAKYVKEQIEYADALERRLFPKAGGEPENDDQIAEAKNVLTMVQATAELFNCSFEQAKAVNYLDAMLALSKRNEEVEKERQKLKRSF